MNIYNKSDIPEELQQYFEPAEIGLEETPEQYISKLVDVFREVKRALRADGTLWVNIGDSYAGGGRGSGYSDKQDSNKGSVGMPRSIVPNQRKPKDLIGIPWMLAFALRADGWYLRQDIIWAKSNPMPESVTDRCTKSHEYIFLFSKSQKYYYDHEAIKEPVTASTTKRMSQDIDSQNGLDRVPGKINGNMKAVLPRYGGKKYTETPDAFNRTKSGNAYDYRPYRNKRDVWTVTTKPYKGAHFATFPQDLIKPCILAGCPENGIVLDPFMGSGTTAVTAQELRRNFIGIELNADYIEMANQRISTQQKLL